MINLNNLEFKENKLNEEGFGNLVNDLYRFSDAIFPVPVVEIEYKKNMVNGEFTGDDALKISIYKLEFESRNIDSLYNNLIMDKKFPSYFEVLHYSPMIMKDK